MACVHRVFTTIAVVLGIAGTVLGIYAAIKISDITGTSPWCESCKMIYPDSWEDNCETVCKTD